MTVTVYCKSCKKRFEEQNVKFVNLEENMYGEDVLTFICPECKTEQTSLRMGLIYDIDKAEPDRSF